MLYKPVERLAGWKVEKKQGTGDRGWKIISEL
jgi:hypothetical protein